MWNNKLVLDLVKVSFELCITPYTTRLREPEDEYCVSAGLIHIAHDTHLSPR